MIKPANLSGLLLCAMIAGCGDEPEGASPSPLEFTPFDGGVRDGSADGRAAHAGGDGAAAASASYCEVKSLLAQHCTACHKSGGVGPFSLERHEDLVRTSASHPGQTIYERVGVRIHDAKSPMPPAGLLDPEALRTLDSWIAAGAPKDRSCPDVDGPVNDAAPFPTDCDATYRILAHAPGDRAAPYLVPAGSEIHPKITVDAPWGNEEVQAIAFRPITDNAKVLHHWILYASNQTFLHGWAPGKDGTDVVPEDVGIYMPRGAGSMYLDMHYYNREGTEPASDRSGLEICVLKKARFRPNVASVFRGFNSLGGSDLVLAPAHSVNHVEEGHCRVQTTRPVRLLSASPHAHTYAVHMKFTVQKADGRQFVMHDDDYNFEAQGRYPLTEAITIESGDTVSTYCTYTNDTANNVRFGENTADEMCFNFALYYPMGALSCVGGFVR